MSARRDTRSPIGSASTPSIADQIGALVIAGECDAAAVLTRAHTELRPHGADPRSVKPVDTIAMNVTRPLTTERGSANDDWRHSQ